MPIVQITKSEDMKIAERLDKYIEWFKSLDVKKKKKKEI